MNYLISICTQGKRDNILVLISQITEYILNIHENVRLIIVLNDSKSSINLSNYQVHFEQKKGLAYVRNRALEEVRKGEDLIFVDDDQQITQNWFQEITEFSRQNVGAIIGSNVNYRFLGTPSNTKMWDSKKMNKKTATTNGLLIPLSVLQSDDVYFNTDFNLIGDDTEFTYRMSKLGIPILHAQKALIYELVPDHRTTEAEIWKRRLLAAHAYGRILRIHGTKFEISKFLIVTILRFLYFLPYSIISTSSRAEVAITFVRFKSILKKSMVTLDHDLAR